MLENAVILSACSTHTLYNLMDCYRLTARCSMSTARRRISYMCIYTKAPPRRWRTPLFSSFRHKKLPLHLPRWRVEEKPDVKWRVSKQSVFVYADWYGEKTRVIPYVGRVRLPTNTKQKIPFFRSRILQALFRNDFCQKNVWNFVYAHCHDKMFQVILALSIILCIFYIYN